MSDLTDREGNLMELRYSERKLLEAVKQPDAPDIWAPSVRVVVERLGRHRHQLRMVEKELDIAYSQLDRLGLVLSHLRREFQALGQVTGQSELFEWLDYVDAARNAASNDATPDESGATTPTAKDVA